LEQIKAGTHSSSQEISTDQCRSRSIIQIVSYVIQFATTEVTLFVLLLLLINTSIGGDIWYVLLIWSNGKSYRITHTHTHTQTHTNTNTNTHTQTHSLTLTHKHKHTHTHSYTNTHTHTNTLTHTHKHKHKHKHTHTHTHTQTHTLTHKHTHKHTHSHTNTHTNRHTHTAQGVLSSSLSTHWSSRRKETWNEITKEQNFTPNELNYHNYRAQTNEIYNFLKLIFNF
jgi:hypothetical protein